MGPDVIFPPRALWTGGQGRATGPVGTAVSASSEPRSWRLIAAHVPCPGWPVLAAAT